MEYVHRMICEGCHSFLGFGIRGRSYLNFLVSTVARPYQRRTQDSIYGDYICVASRAISSVDVGCYTEIAGY